MKIAGCTWGVSLAQIKAAYTLQQSGFDTIDVDPGFLTSKTPSTLPQISCLAAGHLFPEGTRLDDENDKDRAKALAHSKAALQEAHTLNVEVAYIGAPNPGIESLSRFRDAACELSDLADTLNIVFCVEPSPPRGLRSVHETLDFFDTCNRDNLNVLLDFAHCLMIEEDPVEAISYCGNKLAYVHFNDTDGVNDDHLALTDGIMDNNLITQILDRLKSVQYRRPLGVESSPALPDPIGSAIKTRNILIENGAYE
tara:strand:+ start:29 stop:790 length:762 start_codon:yes stop_codon:yes gene_type:complete